MLHTCSEKQNILKRYFLNYIFKKLHDMAFPSRLLSLELRQNFKYMKALVTQDYRMSTKTKPESNTLGEDRIEIRKSIAPLEYRFIYPEFLPDPKIEWRNAVREKLERNDMMSRRAQIDIPEFYVGSILAVTSSDQHSPGKTSRFAGICIHRAGCGLRANFTLRNIIDHQGCEVLYEMYDPSIQRIEVLRLEKRLDAELFYLRDALPEYSSFDSDMEPEILPEGTPVPINDVKVKLKPKPWLERWERKSLDGIQDLELDEKFYRRAKELATPWEKYDLMKEYRASVPEEEQKEIFAEVYSQLHNLELTRRKLKRKRTFVKPKKIA